MPSNGTRLKPADYVDPNYPRLHVRKEANPLLPLMQMSDVREHDSEDSLWLVIDDVVYDVTKFYPTHPGGTVLKTYGGRDASDPFRIWHLPQVRAKMQSYAIGRVEKQRVNQYEKEKQELFEWVEKNLMQRSLVWYLVATFAPLIMLVFGVGSVFFSDNFFVHMLGAVSLAEFWHQAAFVGHDVMHNQVFATPRANHLFSAIYGTFLMGLLGSWWKLTHNFHHATVNEWERDPDITHMPIFAVTSKMFLHKSRRELTMVEEIVLKILVPIQHIMYVPVMFFARFNLYVQGLLMLITYKVPTMVKQKYQYGRKMWALEVLCVIGFFTWSSIFFYTIGQIHGARTAFWYYMVCHWYLGVLSVQITLSHWERPMHSLAEGDPNDDPIPRPPREGIDTNESKVAKRFQVKHDPHEWFFQQITTGHNIIASPAVNYYFGGLNYQIEHHIFPSVPRHNLPQVCEKVMPFCERWGIPYCESNFSDALSSLLSSLGDNAKHIEFLEQEKAALDRIARNKARHAKAA